MAAPSWVGDQRSQILGLLWEEDFCGMPFAGLPLEGVTQTERVAETAFLSSKRASTVPEGTPNRLLFGFFK